MAQEEEDDLENSLDKSLSMSFLNANKDLFKDKGTDLTSSLDALSLMPFMGVGKDRHDLASSLDTPWKT